MITQVEQAGQESPLEEREDGKESQEAEQHQGQELGEEEGQGLRD